VLYVATYKLLRCVLHEGKVFMGSFICLYVSAPKLLSGFQFSLNRAFRTKWSIVSNSWWFL